MSGGFRRRRARAEQRVRVDGNELPSALTGEAHLGNEQVAAHERSAVKRFAPGELGIAVVLPALSSQAIGRCIASIDVGVPLARGAAHAASDVASRILSGTLVRPGREAERSSVPGVDAYREDRHVA
jgi:hypothetical protein